MFLKKPPINKFSVKKQNSEKNTKRIDLLFHVGLFLILSINDLNPVILHHIK